MAEISGREEDGWVWFGEEVRGFDEAEGVGCCGGYRHLSGSDGEGERWVWRLWTSEQTPQLMSTSFVSPSLELVGMRILSLV